jgi:hypothetical protein
MGATIEAASVRIQLMPAQSLLLLLLLSVVVVAVALARCCQLRVLLTTAASFRDPLPDSHQGAANLTED